MVIMIYDMAKSPKKKEFEGMKSILFNIIMN